MRLIMHTDGSARNCVGAATSIIFGEGDIYIASVHRTYMIRKSQDAEFWGVIQGLMWIKDYNLSFHKIECHTDSKEVIVSFNNDNHLSNVFLAKLFRKICYELGKDKIELIYSPGHRELLNLNSVCDLQSKAIRKDYEALMQCT